MKEATIRFRCSDLLKEKLEAMAEAKEQTLSDFVRAQLVDLVAKNRRDEYSQHLDPAALHAAEERPREKKPRKAG